MAEQSQIFHLRAELVETRKGLSIKKDLLQKRETLFSHLDTLKHDIEKIRLLTSPLAKDNPSLESIREKLNQQEILLDELKNTQKEVDHRLDHFEEITNELIEKLEKQLAEVIVKKNPEQSPRYVQLEEHLQENYTRIVLLEKCAATVKSLDAVLTSTIQLLPKNWREEAQHYFFDKAQKIQEESLNKALKQEAENTLILFEKVEEKDWTTLTPEFKTSWPLLYKLLYQLTSQDNLKEKESLPLLQNIQKQLQPFLIWVPEALTKQRMLFENIQSEFQEWLHRT